MPYALLAGDVIGDIAPTSVTVNRRERQRPSFARASRSRPLAPAHENFTAQNAMPRRAEAAHPSRTIVRDDGPKGG
ncbi:hypothetical protein [Sorangium sp. So ce1000]|uniref:hypothetical protein n=1 Tax=Sorangium sp. So ce1000 TaxID=3133325 RepID=UPI003F64628A